MTEAGDKQSQDRFYIRNISKKRAIGWNTTFWHEIIVLYIGFYRYSRL